MIEVEKRAFAVGLTVETRSEDNKPVLRGHAAVFNQLSEDLGGFREQVAPGAFADAISTDDVRFLINHEGLPLARNVSKTLLLSEAARGLAIEALIDEEDADWQRLLRKIARGDINQMSFAFSVRPGGQDWAKNDDGIVVRTLKRVRLYDVSAVTFPAYPQTDIAVREMRAWEAGRKPPTPWKLMRALQDQART